MQIVVFKMGEEEYGVQIDHIKEVVITPNVTRMPQCPKYIRGVANVRGNVIALVDLRERFSLEADTQHTSAFTLVVESDELRMGILVSEVPNTISVDVSEIDTNTSLIGDANAEGNYVKGIIKSGKCLILLIDILKIVDQDAMVSIRKTNLAA